MKKHFAKAFSLLVTALLLINMLPLSVIAAESESEAVGSASVPDSVYVKQQESNTCTLAAATNMIRARFYLSDSDNWQYATESAIKPFAWSNGLNGEFTYYQNDDSVHVSIGKVNGMAVSALKWLLDNHPEGVVIYSSGPYTHAVMVTDYDGDTFYCVDSDRNQYLTLGRIPLASTYILGQYGSQDSILANIDQYWVISNYNIASTILPPANPWFDIGNQNNIFVKGGSLTFWFGADNATEYYIGIDHEGERFLTQQISYGQSIRFDTTGFYNAYISAVNKKGYVDSGKVYFYVFDPRDIGQDFYARISTVDGKYRIGVNNDGSVTAQPKSESDHQIWHFSMNDDRSYRIVNKATQGDLNISDGTSVYDRALNAFAGSYSANSNLWYLRQRPNGFAIASKLNSCSSADTRTTPLRNRQTDDSDYQTFIIDYIGIEPAETRTLGGHAYEYFPLTTTWEQAERFCEQRGGHLATIANADENEFVFNYANSFDRDYLWLGATNYQEDVWSWVSGESFSYANWDLNQPDNHLHKEFYLNMFVKQSNGGKWNDLLSADEYNNYSFGFICEYDDFDETLFTLQKTDFHNNKRYEYFSDNVSWQTAKTVCEKKGGHLVVIDDEEENAFVTLLSGGNIWLGITDIADESEWITVTGNPISYSNWAQNQPDNSSLYEHYGEMYTDGRWNDNRNYRVKGFVCEYDTIYDIGDVNLDGRIDIRDVTAIQRHIAEVEPLSGPALALADTNGDGFVNIDDATLLQMYLAEFDVVPGNQPA